VDPNTFLDLWVTGGGNNQTGWSNARYDELIAGAACKLVSRKERSQALQRAERILIQDDVPVLPLYTYVNKGMLSRRVKGWHPNILDQHPLKYIEKN
jgi:oligopeptide transport system substrate-binding protein